MRSKPRIDSRRPRKKDKKKKNTEHVESMIKRNQSVTQKFISQRTNPRNHSCIIHWELLSHSKLIDLKAERSSQSLEVARLKNAKIELSIIKQPWRKLGSHI
jgi:hypothetical protein